MHMSNQNAVAIILSKPSRVAKSDVTGSKRIRGTGHRTKFPQTIHLLIGYHLGFFFFSLLCFLSVLIFNHKQQANRSSAMVSLIEYDSLIVR